MRLATLLLACLPWLHAERYVVEFKAASPAESAIASRARNPRQAALRLRAAHRATLERERLAVGLRQEEIVFRLDYLASAFAVETTPERARELAGRPQVRAVHECSAGMRYVLDEALRLVRAPEAWALAPAGQAGGAGMKIGIIDSSLDTSHPALQDPELPVPEGFPNGDLSMTTNRVIAYRRYGDFSAETPASVKEHGTLVTAVAAAVAPKAWIAFYHIGDVDAFRILKAFEDAAVDGMDVLNLSVAFFNFPRPSDHRFFEVVAERAMQLGTAVVWAAGNSGPERSTLNGHSLSEANLVVGGSRNTRLYGGTLRLSDGTSFPVVPYDGVTTGEPIAARLREVRPLDAGGGCNPLPERSLAGMIAMVEVSFPCPGDQRLANLVRAGAAAVVTYRVGTPLVSSPGWAAIDFPAVALGYEEALQVLKSAGGEATLTVARERMESDAGLAYVSSSAGPTHDLRIKPDLVAVAQHVWAPLPDNSFGLRDGTSIAAPQVAGGLAVLKAARPGLTPPQLYSLVTNTATAMELPVMVAGAGRLNVEAAMRATLAAMPRSISFGAGGGTVDQVRELTLTNLGESEEVVELSVTAAEGQTIPRISPPSVTIPAGGTAKVSVRWQGTNLKAGEYQGFIRAVGQGSGTELRVAYWYAVPSGVPAAIKVLGPAGFNAGSAYRLYEQLPQIRVLDAAGVPITSVTPRVTVLSGGATLSFLETWSENPGVFYLGLRLGPAVGNVVLRVQAGTVTRDHTLSVVKGTLPHLETSLNALEFGGVLLGSFKDVTVPVANTGGGPLVLSNPVYADPQFRVVSPSVPLTIAPGATANVVIRFTPGKVGAASGAVEFTTNEPLVARYGFPLSGTGAPAAGPLTLQVDGGVASQSFGYGGGAAQAYFVNRLTPPKYPAVLQSVQIYFSDRPNGLRRNAPLTVVARPNPEGAERLAPFSFLQMPGTVTALNAFNSYPFPAGQTLRIESGDFVVGFLTNNAEGVYPVELDQATPSQRRSYSSAEGRPLGVIDTESRVPGNFLIRAVVTFP